MTPVDFFAALLGVQGGEEVLLIIGRSSVLLLVAWCATLLLHKASAATRHMVWTLSFVSLLLLPAADRFAPTWTILPAWLASPEVPQSAPTPDPLSSMQGPQGVSGAPAVPSTSDSEPTSTTGLRQTETVTSTAAASGGESSLGHRLAWLWVLGSVGVFVVLLVGMLRVRLLGLRARPIQSGEWLALRDDVAKIVGLRRTPRLLISEEAPIPMIWGLVRPHILLPIEAHAWGPGRRRNVLMHEMAHVQRGDLIALLLSALACVLYWFNPLVWFACARMRMEREHACDDVVLAAGSLPSEYAEDLLDVVRSLQSPIVWAGAIAMAQHSQLGERLRAVLDPERSRGEVSGPRKAMAVLVGLVVTVGTVAAAPALDPAAAQGPFPAVLALDGVVIPPVESEPVPTLKPAAEPDPAVDLDLAGASEPVVMSRPMRRVGRVAATSRLPVGRVLEAAELSVASEHTVTRVEPSDLGTPSQTRTERTAVSEEIAAPRRSAFSGGRIPDAQTVEGRVLDDTSGLPVEGAEVDLLSSAGSVVRQTLTDERGRFKVGVPDQESYRLRAMRLGYEAATARPFVLGSGERALAELRLQVSPIVLDLIEAVVEGQSLGLARTGFYRRERVGIGHLLSPEDIATQPGLHTLVDLFRDIPGVSVAGRHLDSSFAAFSDRGHQCRLSVSVDGDIVQRGGPGSPSTLWSNRVSILNVGAVEVYAGQAGLPDWLVGSSGGCGGVVIWTKAYLDRTGQPVK